MNPGTPRLREQILAVLAEHGILSTDDVARTVDPEHCQQPCPARNPFGCPPPGSPRITGFTCRDLVHTFDWHRRGADVYPHLRALERQQLVYRMNYGYDRRVFWGRTDASVVADEVAQLESLLALS